MYQVLVVDDEPFMREGLRTLIDWQAYGFEWMAEATDGEEALALMKERMPDLVVTDIRMPVIDGIELIRRIREELKCSCSILVMSGYSEFEYARQTMRYDVHDYLLKPIVSEDVHAALAKLTAKQLGASGEERHRHTAAAAGVSVAADAVLYEAGGRSTGDILENSAAAHRLLPLINDNIAELLLAVNSCDEPRIAALVNRITEFLTGREVHRNWSYTVSGKLRGEILRLLLPEEGITTSASPNWRAIQHALQSARWSGDVMKQACIAAANLLKEQRAASEPNLIADAVLYLKQHYRQRIQLQELAARFHFNPVYFGRQFKRETGYSFNDYIHHLRISDAKKLLAQSDLKVSAISSMLGYHDAEYFTSKFKAFAGESPSSYKSKIKGERHANS